MRWASPNGRVNLQVVRSLWSRQASCEPKGLDRGTSIVHCDVGLGPISISCFPDDDTVATLSIVRAPENIRVRFTGDRVHAHSSPSEVISQEGGISGRGRARQTVDDRDLQPVRAEASAPRWDGAAPHGQRAECYAEHDNDSHGPAPGCRVTPKFSCKGSYFHAVM